MKIINEFDRSNLDVMRSSIDSKLAELESDFNIKIKLGRIGYSDSNFTAKVECNLVKDGQVIETIAIDFDRYKDAWGLKFPLGFTFHMTDSMYKVIGLKPRNRKYPIICEALNNGKRYKLSEDIINRKYDEKNLEGGV